MSYFAPGYFGATEGWTSPQASSTPFASGPYFAPSFFGAIAPAVVAPGPPSPPVVKPGPYAFDPTEPISGQWELMAWMADTLVKSDLFESDGVMVGREAKDVGQIHPRAWIWPVGFSDQNSASDLAIRSATICVSLAVDDRATSDFANYRALETLENAVVALLEDGPSGTMPSLGGMVKGTYDSPAQQREGKVTPLTDELAIRLFFVYAFERPKF